MLDWLDHIQPDRFFAVAVLAGGALAQLRAARASLRDQGRRIGDLGDRTTRLETMLEMRGYIDQAVTRALERAREDDGKR